MDIESWEDDFGQGEPVHHLPSSGPPTTGGVSQDVIGLLLLGDSVRNVLLVKWRDDRWVLPQLRSEAAWRPPTVRRSATEEPMAVDHLWSIQMTTPRSDDATPDEGWTAVTGVAALDAETITVSTYMGREVTSVPEAASVFWPPYASTLARPSTNRRQLSRPYRASRTIFIRLGLVDRYEHTRPGELVHLDVKKLGKIPDGGAWGVLVGRQATATAKLALSPERPSGSDHRTTTCTPP